MKFGIKTTKSGKSVLVWEPGDGNQYESKEWDEIHVASDGSVECRDHRPSDLGLEGLEVFEVRFNLNDGMVRAKTA